MSRFQALRAALQAELDEPGAITRAEIQAVLDAHPDLPAEGDYSDADYDPAHYA